jgi:hypothetical protein
MTAQEKRRKGRIIHVRSFISVFLKHNLHHMDSHRF